MIRPAQHVLLGQGRAGEPEPTFSPLDLFLEGEPGAFWDPKDSSTLFTDEAGTIPVSSDGVDIRNMKDKSGNGNDIYTNGSAPFWDETKGALFFQGGGAGAIGDLLNSPFSLFALGSVFSSIVADIPDQDGRHYYFGEGNRQSDNPIYYHVAADDNATAGLLGPIFRPSGSLNTYGGIPFPVTGRRVLSCYDHDGLLDFYDNGVLVSSVPFNPLSRSLGFDVTSIGALRRTSAQIFGSIEFHGGVYVSRVMSETDIQNVVSWQAARAGITL